LGLSDLNAKRIALIFLVTVVALVGGNAAYAYLTVERPVAAYLSTREGVLSYQISRTPGSPPEVTIKLDRVPDLPDLYKELETGLAAKLGACRLVIQDSRSPELVSFWDRAHLAVHEAVTSGQFVAMNDRVTALAQEYGIDLRVTVEAERVYLQGLDADGYLYQVVDRGTRGAGG